MRHFITLADFEKAELESLLDMAERIKKGEVKPDLSGKNLILLFFNPSLRTRTSFELAMKQLGGNVVTLNAGGDTWKLEFKDGVVMDGDAAEHIKDAARVLGKYGDGIAVRAFPRGTNWEEERRDPVIKAFLDHAGVPIINMESSLYHPNQVLADIMTIREYYGKDLRGLPVTLSWAYHPNPLPMAVPDSFLLGACIFGMDVRFLRPEGYDLDPEIMERARKLARKAGGNLKITDDFKDGLSGSKVVYAKSWGSLKYYGDREAEREYRQRYRNWIIDREKMEMTDGAYFMHCLPVRRNVVVTDEVIDSSRSIVYDEAENRLHAQKAVLSFIFSE
ncbi:MAG: N-acetylornithine carbamoyltransferase [Spirochaetes bacterium]|nr:MAG: N-acetylornithine carbamoyltransferase [Spirochaetota bacterium]